MSIPDEEGLPALGKIARPIVFSLDLEDHLGGYEPNARFARNMMDILDFLEEAKITGTIFTVGRIARSHPDLVRRVVECGHELGCHSWQHRPLDQEDRRSFATETHLAKNLLEQASGAAVTGFRAPIFSLVRSSLWTLDILGELGFAYSSSIMPVPSPLYSFPGSPLVPYRWPGGLVEFPCPTAQFGSFRLPYLGGIYLRYSPEFLIRHCIRRTSQDAVLWTYIHPYDFDAVEPFSRMPGTSLATSILLWLNRRGTYEKIRFLFRDRTAYRFQDVMNEIGERKSLPIFDLVASTDPH